MMTERHGRAFWEKVVGELERSGMPLEDVARRYDVQPKTLRWWRTQLRRAARDRISLVPVRVGPVETDRRVRVVVGEATIELGVEAPPEYVAALVRALHRA